MTYVNIDRYTEEQVGPVYKSLAAAQSARCGFRLKTMLVTRKGLIDVL